MSKSLLKLQIGPVQEFIAQARSTRDLWSGSYLLSWLMAAGIAKLIGNNGEMIFPSVEHQPLIAFHKDGIRESDQKALLTPNLPNLFVARVPADRSQEVARSVAEAIKEEWTTITNSVWEQRSALGINEDQQWRFARQVERLLSIAWQITPETNGYADAYRRNGWHLDAVRQTRDFRAWNTGQWTQGHEKDSLTGREESIAGGPDYAGLVSGRFKHLFKHPDHLGAITLVKRVWHLTYLKDKKELKTTSKEFPIPSTRGIAIHDPDSDGDDDDVEALPGEKYFAVLALDGDQIGKWISGELTGLTEDHHANFSAALSHFALGKARAVVEEHKGRLIYSGGDDVLALLPADTALACARKLRAAFRESTAAIKGTGGESPYCSVGIAIAHFKAPLQDVVREAQAAEKRAKRPTDQDGYGRSAVAVTLMKRSGEISQWGCKWDGGGIALYEKIAEISNRSAVSAKFPHRVCELLEPYRNSHKGLAVQEDVADFKPSEIIALEVNHAAERQGSRQIAQELEKPLADYLENLTGTQEKLTAVTGLCMTIAFANRNKEPKTIQPEAERQTA